MMMLACLLVVVAAAAGLKDPPHQPPPHSYSGPTLEDLTRLTEALERELFELGEDLSDGTTLTAVIDEELDNVQDAFMPANNLQNDQQDALLNDYGPQIKALQHRVSDILAHTAESTSLADNTADTISDQNGDLDNIMSDLMADMSTINSLNSDLASCKQTFQDDLTSNLANLGAGLSNNNNNLDLLNAFVMDKKCEYGTVVVPPGAVDVTFKTTFTEAPTVAASTVGFRAHLDIYTYDHYDRLAPSKRVENITTTGFSIVADDLSEGMVEVKEVFCSWMACQGLETDVSLA